MKNEAYFFSIPLLDCTITKSPTQKSEEIYLSLGEIGFVSLRRFVVANAAILPSRLLLLVEPSFPRLLIPLLDCTITKSPTQKSEEIYLSLGEIGFVSLRRFVVANAAILPSRLLLLVEPSFPRLLIPLLNYTITKSPTQKSEAFCYGSEGGIRTLDTWIMIPPL